MRGCVVLGCRLGLNHNSCHQKNVSEIFESVKLGNWNFSEQLYGLHRLTCLHTPHNTEVHDWQGENKKNKKGVHLCLQN